MGVYRARVAAGELRQDSGQERCLEALGRVHAGLAAGGAPPRGLYIQGGVGCGKTFCMDLFFECVEGTPKARKHFHSFMQEVHKGLFKLQGGGGAWRPEGATRPTLSCRSLHASPRKPGYCALTSSR